MDTQSFLDNLKTYADRFTSSPQNSSYFFDYFENNYDIYISATPEEREKIREVVQSPPQEDSKPKSFFGKLFQSKQNTSQITTLLILYVIKKALPELKSTGEERWLTSGLVANSMENCYSEWRDTLIFLEDLYQSAEIKGINPEPFFLRIAEISSNKNQQYVDIPMNEMMAKIEWFQTKEE